MHTQLRHASTTDVGVGTDDDIGAQVRCSMANTDENVTSRSFDCFRTDPEVKADTKVSMVSITKSVHPLTEYFHQVSSWHRLKKSTAWFLHYHDNLRRT